MRQGAVHTEDGRRVRVGNDLLLERLGTCVPTFGHREAEEKAFVGRESVYVLLLLSFLRTLECVVGDNDAAQIRDVLAEREFAVHVHIVYGDEAVVLLLQNLCALFEAFRILFRPPLFQIPLFVELAACIVKAMRDFVTND